MLNYHTCSRVLLYEARCASCKLCFTKKGGRGMLRHITFLFPETGRESFFLLVAAKAAHPTGVLRLYVFLSLPFITQVPSFLLGLVTFCSMHSHPIWCSCNIFPSTQRKSVFLLHPLRAVRLGLLRTHTHELCL